MFVFFFFFQQNNKNNRKYKKIKSSLYSIKGQMHCFSMQVVMNKRFLLNLKKKLAKIRLIVFEKKSTPLIPKKYVTEPKTRRLGYSINQLKC